MSESKWAAALAEQRASVFVVICDRKDVITVRDHMSWRKALEQLVNLYDSHDDQGEALLSTKELTDRDVREWLILLRDEAMEAGTSSLVAGQPIAGWFRWTS